jgi:hypothetical protein
MSSQGVKKAVTLLGAGTQGRRLAYMVSTSRFLIASYHRYFYPIMSSTIYLAVNHYMSILMRFFTFFFSLVYG